MNNRYVCQNCGRVFEQDDFSDTIWAIFCCMECVFAWCRAKFPKPKEAK